MQATKVAVKQRTIIAQIVVGGCGSASHLLQVHSFVKLGKQLKWSRKAPSLYSIPYPSWEASLGG